MVDDKNEERNESEIIGTILRPSLAAQNVWGKKIKFDQFGSTDSVSNNRQPIDGVSKYNLAELDGVCNLRKKSLKVILRWGGFRARGTSSSKFEPDRREGICHSCFVGIKRASSFCIETSCRWETVSIKYFYYRWHHGSSFLVWVDWLKSLDKKLPNSKMS